MTHALELSLVCPPVTISHMDVIAEVCREFKITHREFGTRLRLPAIVEARRVAAYILVDVLSYSTSQAGMAIGLDHSTVISHLKKIKDLMFFDVSYRNQVERVISRVKQLKPSAENPVKQKMNHIAFNPLQRIELISRNDATPAQAVHEAIVFARNNNLRECSLIFRGYQFNIDPTSDLREKLSMYEYARNTKQPSL
ncbi:MAG: hypothetical protein JXR39_11455 [Marinilabiliaceae bacterium]|nr:hypothetical protein [Marinilabiliaceae bacterium]